MMSFGLSNDAPVPWYKMNQAEFMRRTAKDFSTHLLPHIKPHYRILDIGCGPGSITLDLARLVPDGFVRGIDINTDSIETARSLAKEQKTQNVEFLVGDINEVLKDMEPESFDIVHANQVLVTLSNPLDVMREMRRLTKPGGIVTTRDNAHRVLVPPIPGLMKNLETFHRFSVSKGADPNFGLRSHVVAHEAGFSWEDIEMSSWAAEESSKEGKAVYVQGAKDVSRAALINSGFATPEETDEHSRAWDEWAQRSDGRFMTLNGALICWKRDSAV